VVNDDKPKFKPDLQFIVFLGRLENPTPASGEARRVIPHRDGDAAGLRPGNSIPSSKLWKLFEMDQARQ